MCVCVCGFELPQSAAKALQTGALFQIVCHTTSSASDQLSLITQNPASFEALVNGTPGTCRAVARHLQGLIRHYNWVSLSPSLPQVYIDISSS